MTSTSLRLGVLLSLAACSTESTRFVFNPDASTARDAVAMDASDARPRECTPGRWSCDGSQRAFRCDTDGSEVASVRCTGGARCVGGAVSCGVCQPGTVRCNPANPEAPQLCAADGHAWEDHLPCDAPSGERCVDGVCQRNCAVESATLNSYLGRPEPRAHQPSRLIAAPSFSRLARAASR